MRDCDTQPIARQIERQVDSLVAEARFHEAAKLAAEAGMHVRAAELFESACEYADACEQAMMAGGLRRAIVFAVLSGDASRVEQVVDALASEPNRARAAAEELRARGCGEVAARLLARVGDRESAARAYAEAGIALEAANIYCALGQTKDAADVLEKAYRANPQDHAVALRLAAMLAERHRYDGAARLLQAIPDTSPLRAQALPILALCFDALGLIESSAELRKQAAAFGTSEESNCRTPSALPEEPARQVVFGRYEIVRPVASSPSSQVYEAIDCATNERVAIKQLKLHSPNSLQGVGRDAFGRLMREARALALLRHANVIPLVELVERSGAVVTLWMDGGSLADMMKRESIVPSRAVEITCAVLGALAEAHRLGIFHRDVKPSNILFDGAGAVRLADFGVAHVSDASHTVTEGVIGTLAYMSPEQQLGLPATPSSDVFGAGAVLFEMLTGRQPELSRGSVRPPSSFHSDLTEKHDSLVLAMIASEPGKRVSSAIEAIRRLSSLRWPDINRGVWASDASDERRPEEERLQPLASGLFFDRWAARRVQLVADTEQARACAKVCASMGGCNASAVLRHDAERGVIWFEIPEGVLLSDEGRLLTVEEGRILEKVLRALHMCGVMHGRVDAEHVVLRGGQPVLVLGPWVGFSECAAYSEEADIKDLRRLVEGG